MVEKPPENQAISFTTRKHIGDLSKAHASVPHQQVVFAAVEPSRAEPGRGWSVVVQGRVPPSGPQGGPTRTP